MSHTTIPDPTSLSAGISENGRHDGRLRPDKFTGIDWTPSQLGSPVIDGSLATRLQDVRTRLRA